MSTDNQVLSIGDVVFVKTQLNESLPPRFVEPMCRLKGKPVTIKEVRPQSDGRIFYRIKEMGCSWTHEWFDIPDEEQEYEYW